MRVSAMTASRREDNPLRHATPYEQMLIKLAADRRTLKEIHSKSARQKKSANCCRFICPG
jgi:hypothetical protein